MEINETESEKSGVMSYGEGFVSESQTQQDVFIRSESLLIKDDLVSYRTNVGVLFIHFSVNVSNKLLNSITQVYIRRHNRFFDFTQSKMVGRF